MSEKMPRVTAAQIIKVLERRGFGLARQAGSHMIFKNESGLRATVPSHAGKILHPKGTQEHYARRRSNRR